MKRAIVCMALMLWPAGLRAAEQVLSVRGQIPPESGTIPQGPHQLKFALVDASGTETFWSHDRTSVGGSEPASSIQLFVSNGSYSVALGSADVTGMEPIPAAVLQRGGLFLRVWWAEGYSHTFRRLPDRPVSGSSYAAAADRAHDAVTLQGKGPDAFEPAGSVAKHEAEYAHSPKGTEGLRPRFYSQLLSLTPRSSVSLHLLAPRDGASMLLWLHAEPSDRAMGVESLELQKAVIKDQAVNTTEVVVDYTGGGWLAGIRESYEFCNSCFKRRLVPTTRVSLDGAPYTDWLAGHVTPSETQALGHIENFVPLGFVRFENSLFVTSEQPGVDNALGSTVIWYYTSRSREHAPAAIMLELDGTDMTPALFDAAADSGSLAPLLGALEVRRYDGLTWQPSEPPGSEELARRPAMATWYENGLSGRAVTAAAGSALLLEAEVELEAGPARFELLAEETGFAELWLDNRWQRLLTSSSEGGPATAEVEIPAAGWYGFRVGLTGTEAALHWDLGLPEGVELATNVRTAPVLGGSGKAAWSIGPVDLGAISPLTAGEHRLVIREGAGNGGDLQVVIDLE